MELTYAPTYVVWTFYFSIYIFFSRTVSNTPITLFTICMLTAFKSLSLAQLSLLNHKLKYPNFYPVSKS